MTQPASNPASADTARPRVSLGVWELAWPTILAMFLQTAVRWVDFLMVGTLGAAALAGVGVGGQFFWLLQGVSAIVPTGLTALLARAVGAGDHELADASFKQSLWMSGVLGVVTMVALLPFSYEAIALYGVDADVVRAGGDYLFWLMVGAAPMSVAAVYSAAWRAAGDVFTPLWIGGAANLLNIGLNWLLIFGHWGFPALGVEGAAIASSVSVAVQIPVFHGLWRRGRTVLKPGGASWRPDRVVIRRLSTIGWPVAVEGGVFQVALLIFSRFIAPYGTPAVAAYNVGAQILQLAYLPGVGFATAAATLVGQHLGEGSAERAARSGWRSLAGAVVSMTALGLIAAAFSHPIALLFSDDPEVVRLTSAIIWIFLAVMPLMAIEFTLGGALRGAGDTRFPVIAVFVGLFVFRLIPAGVVVHVLHWPVEYVYCALIFDYLVKGAMLSARFARGRWRTITV